jgi:hypothetical protein
VSLKRKLEGDGQHPEDQRCGRGVHAGGGRSKLKRPWRHAFPHSLGLELELAHADEVLVDLGEALLVAVLEVLGEELQLLRHLLQRLRVVLAQLWGEGGEEGVFETKIQTLLG